MPGLTFRLKVAVPGRLVSDLEVASLQLPLATGYLGVLPGHAPMLARIGTGVVTYAKPGGGEEFLAIDGGTVEILPDVVRVLADRAEVAAGIDTERARQALQRARQRFALGSVEVDVDRAQRATARASARLAAARER